MSNLALIAVVLRLAGIWIVWRNGLQLTNMLLGGSEGFPLGQYLFFLAQASATVLIGLVILIWPATVAKLLTPRALVDDGPSDWLPADIGAVAFGVTGLIFIATTLGDSSTWNAIAIFLEVGNTEFQRIHSSEVLGIIVRLIIGIGLVWGAGGLSRIMSFGRRARLDNKLFKEDT